jgi:hypothetical protein
MKLSFSEGRITTTYPCLPGPETETRASSDTMWGLEIQHQVDVLCAERQGTVEGLVEACIRSTPQSSCSHEGTALPSASA